MLKLGLNTRYKQFTVHENSIWLQSLQKRMEIYSDIANNLLKQR